MLLRAKGNIRKVKTSILPEVAGRIDDGVTRRKLVPILYRKNSRKLDTAAQLTASPVIRDCERSLSGVLFSVTRFQTVIMINFRNYRSIFFFFRIVL